MELSKFVYSFLHLCYILCSGSENRSRELGIPLYTPKILLNNTTTMGLHDGVVDRWQGAWIFLVWEDVISLRERARGETGSIHCIGYKSDIKILFSMAEEAKPGKSLGILCPLPPLFRILICQYRGGVPVIYLWFGKQLILIKRR